MPGADRDAGGALHRDQEYGGKPLRIPTLASTIERRLLINYRLDPDVALTLLPVGLRPQLIDGSAVAGICLLRLGGLRPAALPVDVGWRAENAAHRIAVEWDDRDGITHAGVWVPERHSSSRVAVWAGDRVFPGIHHPAVFEVSETEERFQIGMRGDATRVTADVERTDVWRSSLFPTLDEASNFFRNGAIGWSPRRRGGMMSGVELRTTQWKVEPARATRVDSSFFDALPVGSATFDCALLMRDVPVTWSTPSVRVHRGGVAPRDRESLRALTVLIPPAEAGHDVPMGARGQPPAPFRTA